MCRPISMQGDQNQGAAECFSAAFKRSTGSSYIRRMGRIPSQLSSLPLVSLLPSTGDLSPHYP